MIALEVSSYNESKLGLLAGIFMKSPQFLVGLLLLSITVGACTPAPQMPLQLATFTENYVNVSISLEQSSEENYLIAATFMPPDGYHLYSKDIPVHGINGIGRPTLLELTTSSQMKALGNLTENVPAEGFFFEHREFQVYPLGAVTLSLPIELPPGLHWVDDELKITFMACSSNLCKAPVEGKIVTIRLPGADMVDNE
jgi:hypothetical protein